jgi:hypothetical protein
MKKWTCSMIGCNGEAWCYRYGSFYCISHYPRGWPEPFPEYRLRFEGLLKHWEKMRKEGRL